MEREFCSIIRDIVKSDAFRKMKKDEFLSEIVLGVVVYGIIFFIFLYF